MVRSASTFALVFLFLSCARPALCAPAEPVYTESYPAVGWQEVGKEETDSLQLLWYGEYPPTKENIRAGKVNSFVSILHGAGHPLLDSLLPGSRIYHIAEQLRGFETTPRQHHGMVYHSGRFYGLDRLNYLLRDAGFKFDTTEMADITRIAVLFTLADKQAKRHQTFGGYSPPLDWVKPDSADLATAFPAVKFGEVVDWAIHASVDGQPCYAGLSTERVYGVAGRLPTGVYFDSKRYADLRSPRILSLWESQKQQSGPADGTPPAPDPEPR